MVAVLLLMASPPKKPKLDKSSPEEPPLKESEPFNFRIMHSLREELDQIAAYTGTLNASELVRGWIRDEVNEYRQDRLFQHWLAQHNKVPASMKDPNQEQIA